MELERWTITVACFWGTCSTGLIYLFSIYSGALKKQFDFSQGELELINTAVFCAGILGVFPGWMSDRLGPSKAMLVGGATMGVAFTFFWLIARRILLVPSPAVMMSLCGAIGEIPRPLLGNSH